MIFFGVEPACPSPGQFARQQNSPGLCSCSVLGVPCHPAGWLVVPRRFVACLVLLKDRCHSGRKA